MNENQELDEDGLPKLAWLDNQLKDWLAFIVKRVDSERERCAKICDEMAAYYRNQHGLSMDFADGEEVATELANRIRSKQ
jgi:hypothetical protein